MKPVEESRLDRLEKLVLQQQKTVSALLAQQQELLAKAASNAPVAGILLLSVQQAGTHEEELQGKGGKGDQVGELEAASKSPAVASRAGLTQIVGGSPVVTLDIQGVAV